MIQAVIFDLGGVLIANCEKQIMDAVAKELGVKTDKLKDAVKELEPMLAKGEINLLELYKHVLKRLNKKTDVKSLVKIHLATYKKFSTEKDSEVLSLIRKLKDSYTVACLTNTESDIADINKKNGLYGIFEKAYASSDLKSKKPDVATYNKVLQDMGCQPEDAVFIDDKAENIAGAKKAGLNTIQFKDAKQLKKALTELGILDSEESVNYIN